MSWRSYWPLLNQQQRKKEASSLYIKATQQQSGGGKHDHTISIKSLAHQHFADEEEKKENNSMMQQKCSLEYSPGPGPLTTDILNRLDRANILAKDDKLLLAAYTLHGIDNRHLQPLHHDILREAALFKELLRDNTTYLDENNNHGGWIKQGQHHGRHNFSIYYKLNNNNNNNKSSSSGGGGGQELSCRLETVIHSDLLVPLLSVLNESELYGKLVESI